MSHSFEYKNVLVDIVLSFNIGFMSDSFIRHFMRKILIKRRLMPVRNKSRKLPFNLLWLFLKIFCRLIFLTELVKKSLIPPSNLNNIVPVQKAWYQSTYKSQPIQPVKRMKELLANVRIPTMESMRVQSYRHKTSLLKIQILHDLPLEAASWGDTFLGDHIDDVVRDFYLLGVLDQFSQIGVWKFKRESGVLVYFVLRKDDSWVDSVIALDQYDWLQNLVLDSNIVIVFKCQVFYVVVVCNTLFDKVDDFIRGVEVLLLEGVPSFLRFLKVKYLTSGLRKSLCKTLIWDLL